jgi:hypothetical protein
MFICVWLCGWPFCSDDPGAWDISIRHHVIPISPFQPCNNSHEHLMHVIWIIENAAQRFFESLHAQLPPLTTTVPPHGTPLTTTDAYGLSVGGGVASVAASPLPAPSPLPAQSPSSFAGTFSAVALPVTPAPADGGPRKVDRRIKGLVKALKIVDIVQEVVHRAGAV